MDQDLVSVVVPAYNEEASLGACLDAVLAQDHPVLQVVVVDGASEDRTAEVVQARMARDSRVELVQCSRQRIPASLNAGLARARGAWFVRVDAHSTIPPDYVRLAVERLREGRWGGVGGRKDAVGRTPAGRAIAVALGSRLGVGGSTYHHGTAVQEVDHVPFGAYPTELLRRLGGWDEGLEANEDFELDQRVRATGRPLLFDPRMVISWECRQSVPELWRQYHRYGRGKADVAVRHPRSLRGRHVLPPALVLYTAAAGLVAGRRPRSAVVMVLPYAAVVVAESGRCARQLPAPREALWLPAAFVTMHLAWGTGFLRQASSALRRR